MIKELVEFVVKSLVDNPEAVAITVTQEGAKNWVKVKVGDQDLGRVIGKDGQTIRALRALITAVAPEQDVSVDISK